MSTALTPTPAVNPAMQPSASLVAIANQTAVYLPIVNAGIQAVEAAIPTAPSQTKAQTAINIISAIAKTTEQIPNPNVQLIAALVDLSVQTLNSTGIFSHFKKSSTPASSAAVPAAVPAAVAAAAPIVVANAHPGFWFTFGHPHEAAAEKAAAAQQATIAAAVQSVAAQSPLPSSVTAQAPIPVVTAQAK